MKKIQQRYRYSYILLKQLVKTDFKLRYQGSALGYLWSLLRPLLLFLILYIVFDKFLKFGSNIPHYPVYLLLGIVLWNYFVEVTTGSVSAIVGKGDLMRKINFPKYIIIFAGSMSASINLLLNFIVIGFFMYLSDIPITTNALVFIPIAIELFVLSTGLAFFLSALFVKYRDVSYIWEVIIQAAFYATPILYGLSLIPEKAAKLLLLNPMAQIIQDSRWALVTPQSQTIYNLYGGDRLIWLIPIALTAILAVTGAIYFRRRSKYFAEEV